MIGRIASSPKQAVSLPLRNIVTKFSLTQWRGGFISEVYAHLAVLTRLVSSLLMDVCTKLHPCSVCAQSFSKESFCFHAVGRGKKEGKSICQHGIDDVRKNSVCILLRVCLKGQPSCWLMFFVSGQGAVGSRVDYKSRAWPPSVSYTISEAALGLKVVMYTISFLFSLVLKENANLLLT